MNRHLLFFVWRYLAYNKGKSLVLWFSLTMIFALPMCLGHLTRLFEHSVRARAIDTPLVLGVKGNEYDLTLHALYFQADIQDTFPVQEWHALMAKNRGVSVPLALGFTAFSRPIVGTTLEYFEARSMQIQEGSTFVQLGQCVLGSEVAESLGLDPGMSLMSDASNVFNLAGDYPLKMKVSGIFTPTGTPDDYAIFVDLKTHWIMEGLGHGHESLSSSDDRADKILQTKDGVVTASASVLPYLEINQENQQTFHFHSAMHELPVTSLLIWPSSVKSETLLMGEFNHSSNRLQLIRPLEVVESMMAWVIRIKQFMDLNYLLIGCTVFGMASMIFFLSVRLRSDEFETFHYLGCRRTFVSRLVIFEWGALMFVAACFAVVITLFADRWMRWMLSTV